MENSENLKRQRGVYKGNLTRTSRFLSDITDEQISQVPTRLKICEESWISFNKCQLEIENSGIETAAESETERFNFTELYCEIVAKLQSLIDSNRNKIEPNLTNEQGSNELKGQVSNDINLPAIEVPTFSGAFESWLEFRDIFFNLVDSNSKLSETQKFYYLKRSLKGEAADVIRALENSTVSYRESWALLTETYENKKLIGLSHLKNLCEFPMMTRESYSDLKRFINQIRNDIRALRSLGIPVEHWDIILIYLLEQKLDPTTRREWKKKVPLKEFVPLGEFIEFLTHKSQYLETEKGEKDAKRAGGYGEVKHKNNWQGITKNFVGTLDRACSVCKGTEHRLVQCKKFLEKTREQKREIIIKERLCWNCLKKGHGANICRAKGCNKCGKKHHTCLHIDGNNQEVQQGETSSQIRESQERAVNEKEIGFSGYSKCSELKDKHGILMSTVVVNIEGRDGKVIKCRALLDSGSESCFITRELSDKLKLPLKDLNMQILGIGRGATHIKNYVHATIYSRSSSFALKEKFLVIESISNNIPSITIDRELISIPKDVVLGDEQFGVSRKVDMLIGSGVFWDLIENERYKLEQNNIVIQKTKLGWVIAGAVSSWGAETGKQSTCNITTNMILSQQLERFWVLNEYNKEKKLSMEEEKCEQEFMRTTKVDKEGRFVVLLPFKDNVPQLGKSYEIAEKRLFQLERKLEKNREMKTEYHKFMEEYIKLGHMTKIESGLDTNVEKETICYLPHHGIMKMDSSTTKLRVVFDASAPTNNGISLNNKLMVGPKLQEDLFSILVRFREHQIVVVGDIAKMYRQIWVNAEHRDFQRILWRFSQSEPIGHYHLNTVTYGTASASYLAVKCLHQLSESKKSIYPEAAEIIQKDFYMDDLLTGAESVDAAIKLREEVSTILESGGFHLRKWRSNCRETILKENQVNEIDHFIASEDDFCKTLGLYWHASRDVFGFKVILKEAEEDEKKGVTKRSILSIIAQLFDPLGVVGPVVLRGKLILQALWREKAAWDEEVSQDLLKAWESFKIDVKGLEMILIDRKTCCRNSEEIQLHIFCDASVKAYGACAYIRSKDTLGEKRVNLVASKSRVAPLKVVSLPRLELCGALVAAKLGEIIRDSLRCKINKIVFWSDSTIVLGWLNGEPVQWTTFVANRVSEIQCLTKGHEWNHISSGDNPADLISRGVGSDYLKSCDLWWHGPSWLSEEENYWPRSKNEAVEVPERNSVKICLINKESHSILRKYSSWHQLLKVVGLCLRFEKNARDSENKVTGPLTIEERERALRAVIKLSQEEHFENEVRCLRNSNKLPSSSKLLSLNPCLDKYGIMRVGGRLAHSDLNFNEKHPIILSDKCNLATLLIRHEHYRNLHSGAQALLYQIRQRFWLINGRGIIRKVLHKCLVCFRVNPKNAQVIMGNLPKNRVTPARPFEYCGLDFCGPFEARVGKIRGAVNKKCYLCVFVCFVIRAVHLEIIEDLSTHAFLNGFKRFISRRGIPSELYSDNASNFQGSNNEIQKILQHFRDNKNVDTYSNYFATMSIRWHFIPPRSPHFGGLWEAAIKSAKYHLKRVVGEQKLTFDELYTVVSQIEACMNSRPLIPLSSDPADLNSLTPGHFLIGAALTSYPQQNLLMPNMNRLNRFQLITQMVQGFWSRWRNEYMNQLQQRSKWKKGTTSVAVGDLVLLKDANTPPMRWPTGRVLELHHGTDGQCRVVTVKTSAGVYKRAVTQICLLPVN